MEVVEIEAALRAAVAAARRGGALVGLVPTMGALHEGHCSLIRRAASECGFVVATIFVNPTQFAPTEDLSRYPRPFEEDCRLAREAGAHLVFAPTPETVYPPGFSTTVHVEGLTAGMESASRPTHFAGVTTVCAKLFNLAQADRAYFGRKDFQQLAVVQRMVVDLNFPLTIVPCETVREPDGLAMSSRNRYLTPDQSRQASFLSAALFAAGDAFAAGQRDAARLRDFALLRLGQAEGVRLDYLDLVDAESLQPVETVARPAALCVAAYVGSTRLIDNVLLDPRGGSSE